MKKTSKNIFVVLSPPQNIEDEEILVSHLLEEGLEYFHLRKPDADEQTHINYLRQIPLRYHGNIVLHSHFHLMQSYAIRGIHFGARNISLLHEYLPYNCHKSISLHHPTEIDDAQQKNFSYAFFSPVFTSISKNNYHPQYTISSLNQYYTEKAFTLPLIALGGICQTNIDQLKDSCFSGIAIMSALWDVFQQEGTHAAIRYFKSTQNTWQRQHTY